MRGMVQGKQGNGGRAMIIGRIIGLAFGLSLIVGGFKLISLGLERSRRSPDITLAIFGLVILVIGVLVLVYTQVA